MIAQTKRATAATVTPAKAACSGPRLNPQNMELIMNNTTSVTAAATPREHELASAFHTVTSMERPLADLRDLAIASMMAVENHPSMDPEQAGALYRLAKMIRNLSDEVEEKRGDLFHLLRARKASETEAHHG